MRSSNVQGFASKMPNAVRRRRIRRRLCFVSIVVNTAEHVRKLRDEQKKHDQTRLQYDEFLKSLVYKWNPLFWI